MDVLQNGMVWSATTPFAWSEVIMNESPKRIVNVNDHSELAWCGAEGWISNPPQYPSCHLDCRAIKAAGVGTWGEGLGCVVHKGIGEGGGQGSK
ncbi:hypothetical protein AVEN_70077-1 [Araneus ventricosus]|uniref:Uncharacterized protein n=1 Tax=Araneus ventricosus TaxID=182803 RepID=A0A4Y1ZSQ6_ARAVE|nr:hypothetical protein AVEN_26624-1 [Araneus ventricosus]GBL64067.1 hypothetical protein AVEN_174656-1 [Araneus ventricosus]GBM74446.1 hypothetical protein AVEN_6634-1 [Araneus ventricosus]GBM74475.1 hypothetical protein AVEN_70077-1 [Araneus ventricosus]